MTDAAVLERVLRCLPPGWKPASRAKVGCMYSFVVGDATGKVKKFHILYRGSERLARSHDFDSVLETLEEDLQRHVAAFAEGRVFLHAGAVGWRGRAIILPGRTYAGKSTLVDALVRAGATYYSDEYAVLDERGRVHPYARPLKLRARRGETTARAAGEPASIGTRALPVGLVALTRYEPGAEWQAQALSPGEALLALMESAVPVRNRPGATLQALQAVVTSAQVVRGVRGEVEQAVEAVLSRAFEGRGRTEGKRAKRVGSVDRNARGGSNGPA